MRLPACAAVAALALGAGPAVLASSAEPGTRAVSQDGSTAVELQSSGPSRARLTVVDRSSGDVRRAFKLSGDFSLDAISPDGRTVYVIRYLSADREHYAVQWLSTARAGAVLHTVVEKGEPGEEMAGVALSRASRGEWVYTLYDGAGHTPFVHALNTAERFTVCIDLDSLAGRSDLESLGLRIRADRLEAARAGGRALVHVDTGTFEVSEAEQPPVARPRLAAREPKTTGDAPPLLLLAGAAGMLAALLVAGRRLMRPDASP